MQKHHNVDSHEGDLFDKDDEVDPCTEDSNHPDLPLPAGLTVAIRMEDPHKHNGAPKDEILKPVDPVCDVLTTTQ